MTDQHAVLMQQAILARAAELKAVAAEMNVDLGRLVDESRKLSEGTDRLRQERYRLRSSQRASQPREDQAP